MDGWMIRWSIEYRNKIIISSFFLFPPSLQNPLSISIPISISVYFSSLQMAKARKQKIEDQRPENSSAAVVRHQKLCISIDIDKRLIFGYFLHSPLFSSLSSRVSISKSPDLSIHSYFLMIIISPEILFYCVCFEDWFTDWAWCCVLMPIEIFHEIQP